MHARIQPTDRGLALALLVIASSPVATAQAVVRGQWNFDLGDLGAVVGQPLGYLDGANGVTAAGTRFATTAELGIPDIKGIPTKVMNVPGGLYRRIGYVMTHGIAPNGGGTRVNQYTLVMDVMVATNGPGAAALLQVSSPENLDDADLLWQGNQFGQGPGGFNGTGAFTAGAWHRIVAAYDEAANPPGVAKYVDGVFQDRWTTDQGFDHVRRTLLPTAVLFADGDQDQRREWWVSSIQIREGAMTDAEIVGLGGPSASKIPVPGGGKTYTFANTSGGNWSTATNWVPVGVPGATDTAVIGASGFYTVTLDTDVTVAGLTQSGNTLTGPGNLTVTGPMIWSGGTQSGTGRTTLATSGTLSLGGSTTLGRTLRNDGTTVWTGTSIGLVAGTIENLSRFVIVGSAAKQCFGGGGANAFNNQPGGVVLQQGTGAVRFRVASSSAPFNNRGVVETRGGNLALEAGGTHDAGFVIGPGTVLQLEGAHTLADTSLITGAGTLLVSGNVAMPGTVDLSGTVASTLGGVAAFTGPFRAQSASIAGASGGTLDFSTPQPVVLADVTVTSGIMKGSALVTVAHSMTLTSGRLEGTGTTKIAPAAICTLAGDNTLNRILRNEGTVSWTGTSLALGGGTVDNFGRFVATGAPDKQCYGNSGVNAFNNQPGGTFVQDATGLVRFRVAAKGVPFNQRGTIELRRGTLLVDAGFTTTASSRVDCPISGPQALVQYGQLQVGGLDPANLAGTLSASFAPGFIPAAGSEFDVLHYAVRGTGFSTVSGEADMMDLVYGPSNLVLRRKPGLLDDRPPVITRQPSGGAANPGDTVVLEVIATGSPAPAYQWRRNGLDIPGENRPQLVLFVAGPADAGRYTCVAYNASGATASDTATVVVAGTALPFADAFANRGEIVSASGVGIASNPGTGREAGEPVHAGKSGGRSVWVDYVAPADGTLELSTAGSDFDTLLAVYTGTAVAALAPVVSDDDGGGFYTSRVRFGVTAGTRYAVAVEGRGGTSGNIVFRWNLAAGATPPPRLLAGPADQFGRPGGTAVFSVLSADATDFQWYRDGIAVADDGRTTGSTTATLSLSAITVDDVGAYAVELRGNGTLRSAAAALQVDPLAPPGPASATALARDKYADLREDRLRLARGRSGAAVAADGEGRPAGLARGTIGGFDFGTRGSGTESGETVLCGVIGGATQWFDYLAEVDGTLTVDTAGTAFDTVMAAFYDDCPECSSEEALRRLVPLDCNNDVAPLDPTSRVSFAITNGSIYSVAVDGVKGASGKVRLHFKAVRSPPRISLPRLTESGLLEFDVLGSSGSVVRVESSPDLGSFTPLATGTLANGTKRFTDPTPPDGERYYRAVFPDP
ncbi:MAG: hypothetical protein DVB31_14380 [Verrucomicrobia bacterium]|nr:MAG: hypothetical protein DVB31_14380 [Verrucomicrobiota bacterium]